MNQERKIMALKLSRETYHGRVFETDIFLDFENMTAIKTSGDGLPRFAKLKNGRNFEDKVEAFKLKNNEKLQDRLIELDKICKDWKNEYVAPAVFVDSLGYVHPASDGYNFKIDIEYSDGTHKHISGSRSCPENYDDFVSIINEMINEISN